MLLRVSRIYIYKLLFLIFPCLLCNHREIRLCDTILITAQNIMADARIQKRLLERCPRSREQRILQHLNAR